MWVESSVCVGRVQCVPLNPYNSSRTPQPVWCFALPKFSHVTTLLRSLHWLPVEARIRYGAAVKCPPLITVKSSLKHFSEQAFLTYLARVSWKDIDLIPSVENAWSFFKSNFLTILDKHAPFKKCRTKNRYSPWFTPDLTALNQHKNILWRSALASNSPHDMHIFREARNQYTQAVRRAKASFFKQKFASCTQTQNSSGTL